MNELKIGSYTYEIIKRLGIDIYEILIEYPEDILFTKMKEFEDRKKSKPEYIDSFVKSLERIGITENFEEVMLSNIDHVFNSKRYYIGGNMVISVSEKEEKYLIAIHTRSEFTNFHISPAFFTTTSLKERKVYDFVSELSMELEVVKILSRQSITLMPIDTNESEYVSVRYLSTGDTEFKYREITHIERISSYYGPSYDRVLEKFIELIKPNVLKCCLNCTNFQFSGMSHDMSGGTAGYCSLLLSNSANREGVKDRITHITSWCQSFSE